MSLILGDNFSYQGAKPLDKRNQYDTVATMAAVSDAALYDGCLTYCLETRKTYQWLSTNTVDATLGKWREFESGANVTVDDELSDTSTNPVQNAVIKQALDGKADLVDGKVPAAQLPSYVDDVLEYEDLAHFPATGETGKIYVALDTNKTYRWSGSGYTEISESLALGETSSTAYRGDRGKIAYDFSQTPYTSNPEMDGTASAGSSTEWAKGDHVHPSDTSKENTFRYSTMPTASATNEGKIVQYIGATNSTYTTGYFYKCVSDGESTPTYSWSSINVQEGGGSGTDEIFKGSLAAWNALTAAEKEAYKIVVLTQLHAITLTVGDQYTINEKTFKVAEDLGNGVYAMQANTSWGSSAWPGYLAAGGTTTANFANQSIAPYVSAVNTWYNDNVKAIESDDYKYGPYLITDVKAQKGAYEGWDTYPCGGPYVAAIRDFAGSSDGNVVWIGTHYGDRWALAVTSNALWGGRGQEDTAQIAPAFNLDTKKVVIDDNDVITPGSSAGEVFTYNPLTGGLEAAGHTIVNGNGEEMPSRMNLKFGGDFSVTDDSTNDATVVIPHRITSEEMQDIVSPLPSGQRTMPILFDETGAEYVVGWYKRASDGKKKPVYEKSTSVQLSGITDGTNKDFIVETISNLEKCFYIEGYCYGVFLNTAWSNGYFLRAFMTGASPTIQTNRSMFNDKDCYVTYRYIKTSDSWQ